MARVLEAATLGTMELAIYAHPWDLRALSAHGGLPRLRDLGFAEVSLAVSYHAGRWLTPWHPDGMVRFLEDGTVHYRPRADYGLLQPKMSGEVRDGEPSPLERLCEHGPRAGLRARAWAVLTHNTRLGELHPECCVQNAFGDRYTYSLCPSNEHVLRYVAAMVGDLAAHSGLHAIELEAIAPIGHRHNSHHDKSSFASEVLADVLLSACFCAACTAALAALKYEDRPLGAARVTELRAAFASWLRRRFAEADCMQPAEPKLDRQQVIDGLRSEFGEDAGAIVGYRAFSSLCALLHVATEVRARTRICAQTNYDALRQSTALALPVIGEFVQEAALTVYGEKAADVAVAIPHLVAARGRDLQPPLQQFRQPALRLCLHPRAPQYSSDDDLRMVRDLCRQHGVAAIAIYHLGLLPWRTIERAARVLSA